MGLSEKQSNQESSEKFNHHIPNKSCLSDCQTYSLNLTSLYIISLVLCPWGYSPDRVLHTGIGGVADQGIHEGNEIGVEAELRLQLHQDRSRDHIVT